MWDKKRPPGQQGALVKMNHARSEAEQEAWTHIAAPLLVHNFELCGFQFPLSLMSSF